MTVMLHDALFPPASITVYVTIWLPIPRTGDPDGLVVTVSPVSELSLVVAAGRVIVVSGSPSSVF